MKKIIVLLFLFFSIVFQEVKSQFGLSAGTTLIKPFGAKGVSPAFHIGGEYGSDDQSTIVARITFAPNRKGKTYSDLAYTVGKLGNETPYSYFLESTEKMNYTMIEAGKRYYFLNGYDNGLALYGGSLIFLTFNKVQYDVEEFDENKYDLFLGNQKFERSDLVGNIFSFAFGLNAGVKSTHHFGTIYFDTGMNFAISAMPSNEIAQSSSQYRNLNFYFNLGFRKDFY